MNFKYLVLSPFFLATLSCGSMAKPVSYSKKTITTDKQISINFHSGLVKGGSVTGMTTVGGVSVPIQTGEHAELRFNEDDQKRFIDNLKGEISRMGLAKIANDGRNAKVSLLFAQTQHSGNTHKYLLDVVMTISSNGKKDFVKKYFIDSEEGVGFFTKMNTNASDGKTRASQMLIDKLIPDIESYLQN
jgi:hypothetical protein